MSYALRKLVFYFLSNWMGYDRGDSFSFDFEPNGNLFGSKSKGKPLQRSYPIQCERKWKYSFLSVARFVSPCMVTYVGLLNLYVFHISLTHVSDSKQGLESLIHNTHWRNTFARDCLKLKCVREAIMRTFFWMLSRDNHRVVQHELYWYIYIYIYICRHVSPLGTQFLLASFMWCGSGSSNYTIVYEDFFSC